MSSTTTTTSTSPNASETSISEPSNKDLNNMGGFISTLHNKHAGFVPMFGSSPSPSMMQTSTVFNNMIERFPMLEQGLINMPASGGYFEGTGSTPCFSQCEVHNNKGSCYLENEVFESVNIGVEGDMFVPPLENVTCKREETTNSSYFDDDINSILNNCNNIGIAENKAHHGVENLFQQELATATGEWDFEELMKDVSSFPFLDFSY